MVRGDHAERLRGELRPELGAYLPALLKLSEDLRVVLGAGDRRDAGRVARGGAEQRGAAHVDHVDGLVDADQRSPDLRAERSDVDDDEIDRLDGFALELVELLGLVAPGEDPGVHRVMERLDLAVEHRRDAGDIGDRPHLYPVLGEVLPRSVRGKQLDVERLEASRKDRDSVPRRDREQRSHPQSLHVVPGILGPMASGAPPRSSES